MRVDGLIERALGQTKLKKVRIKVDPSQLSTFGYENVSSFEGYILSESIDTVEVYVLNVPSNIEPIQTVDKKHIEPVQEKPSFDNFKKKILTALQKNNINKDNPSYKNILNSNNDEFIETYLKELGYESEKLKAFYKNILQNESGIDLIPGLSPIDLLKTAGNLAGKAVSAYSSIPKFVVGKNNFIGKLGKFIRTLNPNDLVDVDRYGKAKSKEYPTGVREGDTIYVKNLPLKGLKTMKHGVVEYQASGMTTKGIFEGRRKVNQIIELEPTELAREIDLSLDFAVLGNPEQKGILIIKFKKIKEQDRYYNAKVMDYQGSKIISVLNRITDQEGKISLQTIQDEVRQTVRKALEELLANNLPDDLGDMVNKISDKILPNKDRNLDKFDKVMQKLAELPQIKKSTKPIIFVLKELKGVNLI
jgi:hypothetical protein